MARSSALALVVLMVLLVSFVTSSEGRNKFVVLKPKDNKNLDRIMGSSDKSMFLSALPKGRVPSSAPTKKGHADVVNQKLIARHLIAVDRSLRSVPSPGVGH
ncbi:hypothetical protein L484_004840 [Morus notabilis]|uniref:FAS1 domain-containing protein n=1 Tax=Morus notabilis TaxID=981085 RepID=W9S580_9ROSA|nr:precursor of CEP14 [Morus notabilis]EXC10941.1 hypothetical protein L484_004840 [Morus notabilis]